MKSFFAIVFVFAVGLGQTEIKGQVQISFQPSVYGKTLDGLSFFQINNQTSFDFKGALRITVSEDKAGKVAEINIPSVYIKRGINIFNRTVFGSSRFKFSSNLVGAMLKQTTKFPEGEYEYCFELSAIEDKPGLLDSYENCFQLSLQPLTPLLLVDPSDGEKICNQKPSFLWQSPMPVDFNARYRIIVVEVKDKQSPIEALSLNVPVVNVGELREPRLNYPSLVKELDKSKSYAWQVYYSVNNLLITKSEIWAFKIDCEEEKEGKTDDSYRELKTEVNGDFYVATKKIKFAVNNAYNDADLIYKITNLKEPGKFIEHLPKLKLASGINKYQLNLSEYKAFRSGEQYQLEVQLPNGQKMSLRFTYQE
jgi:hypothetical protein